MRRLVLATLAGLVAAGAGPELAAPCTAPAWFREGGLKGAAGEVVGLAKHADAAVARRDARRDIARRLVKERGRDILTLPAVRGKVNQQVYSEAELARALTLVVAAHLPDGRRLKVESACGAVYAAVALSRKDAFARLREAPDLGEDVTAALAGKGDKLEERRREGELRAITRDSAAVERTAKRLLKAAQAMRPEVPLESLMAVSLVQRAEGLVGEVNTARIVAWPEDRATALARAGDAAMALEKLLTALRSYKAKDYAAAADIFRMLGVEGDELAMTALAILHLEAKGVKRDPEEAMALLKKASVKSFGPAKFMLGALYLSGLGATASANEAGKWFTAAEVDGWTCEVEVKQCRRK